MRRAIALLAFAIVTGAANAQDAGDRARGQKFAEKRCAECHAISPGSARSPMTNVATFEIIANTPGMSAMAINVWLTTPHREMPHLILSPEERDDVIAYITSLKR